MLESTCSTVREWEVLFNKSVKLGMFVPVCLVPGNVVIVAIYMCGKSPITREEGGYMQLNYVEICVFWLFSSFYCRYHFHFEISVSSLLIISVLINTWVGVLLTLLLFLFFSVIVIAILIFVIMFIITTFTFIINITIILLLLLLWLM